jgi:importin subunit alpha-6/7
MRNIAWAVSNLCRGKPAPDLDIVRVSFPFLLKRLLGDDVEAKADACWALSYISDGDNSRIEAILEAGFLQPIVAILDSDSNEMLRTASQRVIGNILSGDESQTQQVLDTSILSIFKKLLIQSHRLDFRKEICWSISNITAGTADQLQRVFDSGILIDIMDLGLNRATPPDLLKECVFCISNATHVAIDNQMTFLVMISGLHFLFRVLPRMSRSNLVIVLEGIVNILQKQPNAIEGIPDEVLKPIPRLTRLPGDVGEMARKIMELIPSRFEGVVLSADTEPFEADDNDDSDSDEWESVDAEEENEDEEGEDDEEEDEGDEA